VSCSRSGQTSTKLPKSASAPWRFANYGRGSLFKPPTALNRARKQAETLCANYRNLAS